MKRPFVLLLVFLLLLLGIQRTPKPAEAQVEGVMLGIVAPIVVGVAVGGCAHAVARPDADPMMMSAEPPATP